MVKSLIQDRVWQVRGSIPASTKCCVLEHDTVSTLLSTGFHSGRPASKSTQLRMYYYEEIDM